MHGVKRDTESVDQITNNVYRYLKALASYNEWKNLDRLKDLLESIHEQDQSKYFSSLFDEEKNLLKSQLLSGLEISENILIIQSENITIWNTRKKVILLLIKYHDHFPNLEKDHLLENELKAILHILKKSPKSYSVWFHRKWCLNLHSCPLWHVELQLLDKLLNLDSRNFHGWSYRKWLCEKLNGGDLNQELTFTEEKINQNFSNYSAWHRRSYCIEHTSLLSNEEQLNILKNDAYKVINAVFSEPDDQSAWFYHRWLIDKLKRLSIGITDFDFSLFINGQIHHINNLLELEPKSKWANLQWVYLNRLLGQCDEECLQKLSKLREMDPFRMNYYKFESDKINRSSYQSSTPL